MKAPTRPNETAPEVVISAAQFRLLALACTVFAFLLLEWFVLVTEVDSPIRGDIVQYVAYAWNLLQHHTFSMAPIGSEAVVPDAFRGPGYPLLLALAMLVGGMEGGWYAVALQGQVLLGTGTVLLTILLGRYWMSAGWSLGAGALLALWPHHIAATGNLLSEVALGFFVVLSLWLAALSVQGRCQPWPRLPDCRQDSPRWSIR